MNKTKVWQDTTDIYYIDTYLALLLFLRLVSITLFLLGIMNLPNLSILQPVIEIIITIFTLCELQQMQKIVKEYGIERPYFIIGNYLAILFINIIGVILSFLPIYQYGYQLIICASLMFIAIQIFFPYLVNHKNIIIVSYIIAGVALLVLGFSTIQLLFKADLIFVIGVVAINIFTCIFIIGMVIALFAGIKYMGIRSIMHEKHQRQEGTGYSLLIGVFILFIIIPPWFFSWFIYFILFLLVIVGLSEICEHVPPFTMWWVGFFFLFILVIMLQ